MSHKRILITLRGDQQDAEQFLPIVARATAAGRSVNSQVLIELGVIDDAKAAAIPRAGRRHKHAEKSKPATDQTFGEWRKGFRAIAGLGWDTANE
jgi:hypothetical protein